MAIRTLELETAIARVGERHARTGFAYPRPGQQPYFEWLVASLELLADASAGDCRVAGDDASPTSVRVMPGRASVEGVVLAFDGAVLDLAAFDDDTALVYLEDDGGASAKAVASATGWPATAHLKLAEVTLAAGSIVAVLDRRFETILKA